MLIAILGAGRSSRYGSDKLVQPCAGKPLGRWALDCALQMGAPIVWIAGEHEPIFITDSCPIAHNPHAAQGLATSVAFAASIAEAQRADALLIMLADMPLVTPALLARLIAAGAPAAFAQTDDRPGVPALIPSTAFAALQGLKGDRGAGPVLSNLAGLSLIPSDADALLDVDQPSALAKAAILLQSRAAAS